MWTDGVERQHVLTDKSFINNFKVKVIKTEETCDIQHVLSDCNSLFHDATYILDNSLALLTSSSIQCPVIIATINKTMGPTLK